MQIVALNALTAFARGQSPRVLAWQAGTGNRDGGEFSATAGPARYGRLAGTLAPRLAGAKGDRESIGGGQPERESPGNGAASP